ncbi:hypothetical protein M9Y10_023062 [Tritrichomonas musculus]|uniref:Serine/threonine-protein phosphatase n=1 Tax=Tritrichomonas musculus TaxID=1915356 RepID=A0ABR2KU12_9EUKA
MEFDIDEVIETLKRGEIVEEKKAVSILNILKEILYLENNLLQLSSPITVCGDVHGQLDDVIYLFKKAGGEKNQKFLFLGDYVDRGKFSINTFLLLACYKLKYKENFYMLRGNHESRQVSFKYGLYAETMAYYGHNGIWFLLNNIFDFLPLAAIIDHSIFAVHGGLSPDLKYIYQLQSVNRMVEVPSTGLIADLLWSDPDEGGNQWRCNSRGSGYVFYKRQAEEFLHNNKLDKIVRAHQLANSGFEYKFSPKSKKSSPSSFLMDKDEDNLSGYNSDKSQYLSDGSEGKLLLVWSAPNYMYTSNNKASILKYNYNEGQKYHLIIFDPSRDRLQPPGGVREGATTSYFV